MGDPGLIVAFRWLGALAYALAGAAGIAFIEVRTRAAFERTWYEYLIYTLVIVALGLIGGYLSRYYSGRHAGYAAVWVPLFTIVSAPLAAGGVAMLVGFVSGNALFSFDSFWRGSALIAVGMWTYGFPMIPAAALVSFVLWRYYAA